MTFIWANIAIFLITSVVWAFVSDILFPNHKYWIDFLAGMTMLIAMSLFGYPLLQ